MKAIPARRKLLWAGLGLGAGWGVVAAGVLAAPALRPARRSLPAMTEGPFYPPRAWRERWPDWDADLTRVGPAVEPRTARGEHLGLELQLADTEGRLIDGCEVEIWQCDALAQYRHPRFEQAEGRYDPGFQGFGSSRSGSAGELRFRTIRPVAYPGRTPHIHILLRHASFGELATQLFVAGDPGNAGDFLWRRLREADRPLLDVNLQPASPGSGLRWQARHTLVLPA
jgi:protocatechuate 3,4-dioxygenase beta subunit